ncbi:MAG: polysaccharide deacetylase family protein [Intestinibacillus sp.]
MKAWKRKIVCALLATVTATLYSSTDAWAAETQLPILMYHNLTVDGETNSMTITQERFREDMRYLAAYGYTPLLAADLVDIRAGVEAMPEKPVMITFDDGYESNYTLAFPILEETGMKATVALITSHIRDDTGGGMPNSMTWQQAKEMYESGIVDIGTHTNRLHNEDNNGFEIPGGPDGIQRRKDEGWMDYQTRVNQDIGASIRMIQEKIGDTVRVLYFSYPFGATDPWFGQILLNNGLLVSTTTQARTADIGNGLYGLPRFRVTMDLPVSKLLQRSVTANPTQSALELDGKSMTLPTYQIDGSNYVKLRDVADLVNGTASQFSVGWDNGAVILRRGTAYEPDGSELRPLAGGGRTAESMAGPLLADGTPVVLEAYRINGNYYFKLRSLGETVGFAVDWNENDHILIIKTT